MHYHLEWGYALCIEEIIGKKIGFLKK
jgi:hypothetical protein